MPSSSESNFRPGADYYEILGVPRSASMYEIGQAFKKLVLECHPDKGGDAEKFIEISEAFNVLRDAKKRKMYDDRDDTQGDDAEQSTGVYTACEICTPEMFRAIRAKFTKFAASYKVDIANHVQNLLLTEGDHTIIIKGERSAVMRVYTHLLELKRSYRLKKQEGSYSTGHAPKEPASPEVVRKRPASALDDLWSPTKSSPQIIEVMRAIVFRGGLLMRPGARPA